MTLFYIVALAVCAVALPQGGSGGLGGLIGSLASSVVINTNGVAMGPAPKGCSKYEIIVARGTGEPGPFGVIVGDSLVSSVKRAIPAARGYAVQYPANTNMSVSAPTGIDDTIKRLNHQNKACPDQKFALVGYSQGAGVMHGVFGPVGRAYPGSANPRPTLDQSVFSKIVALVMFGDPGFRGGGGFMGSMGSFPAELQAKLKENCAAGDPVCDPNGSGFENHLKYVSNPYQSESALFIEAGFKGNHLPDAIKSASDPRWHGAPKGSGSAPKGLPPGAKGPPSGGAASPAKGSKTKAIMAMEGLL